jgi:hypothetical protein
LPAADRYHPLGEGASFLPIFGDHRNDPMHTFVLPFVWGCVVLMSWIGWGQIIASLTGAIPKGQSDLALLAGWGSCAVIFFGGILNATATCGVAPIAALTAIGFSAGLLALFRARSHFRFEPAYLPLIAVALLIYSASVIWRSTWNANDDFMAYLIYPVKMLQTGAAIDPFSLRRLSTLGGQAFLEAQLLLVGRPENIFMIDIGLGGLLACAIVVSMMRRAGASLALASAAGIACLLIPMGRRLNSASAMLPLAEFLVLFGTLHLLSQASGAARKRSSWIAGLICAAIATLRPNFLPIAGLAVLLTELLRPIPWSQAISETIHAAAAGLVAILPWCWALNAAAGSWFYPVFKGNAQYGLSLLSAHLSLAGEIRFIVGFFLRPKMLFLAALGAVGIVGARAPAKSLWIAAMIGTAVVVAQFTNSDYQNLSRYTLPPIAAATLAIWIDMDASAGFRKAIGQCLIIALAVLTLGYACASGSGLIRQSLQSIRLAMRNDPIYSPDAPALYAQAQAAIAPGKRVLTMVEMNFLLDYRRNQIESIDWPGFASPAPGLPFFKGPQALAEYLRAQGIQTLMAVDFDHPNPSVLCRHPYEDPAYNDPQFRSSAPYVLDLMKNIDQLAQPSALLFDQDGLRVITLETNGPQ